MNALRRPGWTAVAVVGATVLAVGATCSVNEKGLGIHVAGAGGAGARAEISSPGGAAGDPTVGAGGRGALGGTDGAISGTAGGAAGTGGGSAGLNARGGRDGQAAGAGGTAGIGTPTGVGGSSVGGAAAGAAGGLGTAGSSGLGVAGSSGLGVAGSSGPGLAGSSGLGGTGAGGRGGTAGNPCKTYPTGQAFTTPDDGRPHCYWFHSEKQTFTTARAQCRSEGGDLVSILSQPENDLVVGIGRFTGSFPQLWIGGIDGKVASDRSGPGTYRWLTGEPWTYSNWNATPPAQPDGYCDPCSANQSCTCDHWATIAMDGTWYDFWEDNPRGFVCEATPAMP